jgi:ribosomal protein L31E
MQINISLSAGFSYHEVTVKKGLKVKDKKGNELALKKGEKVRFRHHGDKTYLKDMDHDDLVFSIKKSDFGKYFSEDKAADTSTKDKLQRKNDTLSKEQEDKIIQTFNHKIRGQTSAILKRIKHPSERLQIEAVKKEPEAIKLIKDPSEKVQLAAVEHIEYAISWIKNPTEKVQLQVLKNHGIEAIRYIKNPTEKVQLTAIKEDPTSIRFIKNKISEKVQIEAVKNDAGVLNYLLDKGIRLSQDVQITAYKTDPETAREYITKPNDELKKLMDKFEE